MAEKTFHDMSLDEVFDLERQGAFHVGRTVVTTSGLARRRARKSGPETRRFAARGSFKLATTVAQNGPSASTHFHVVNDGERWALKKESSRRAVFISHSGTKQDVVREAVRYLKSHGGGSVKIHNRDGSIQEERTYHKARAVRVRG